jgi:transposase, IS30 family
MEASKTPSYTRLTYEQRCQIYALKKRGVSHRAIAKDLAVAPSTIDREIKRNTGGNGYRYKQAHRFCLEKRQKRKGIATKMTPTVTALIEEKLVGEQWSPQQISGWMQATKQTVVVSHERIYQHILLDKQNGGSLHTHLRRKGKKYQARFNGKTRRGQIIGRVDITQRPPVVETRSRIGDWEADTVVGLGHRNALVTLVERKTRLVKILKVTANTAEEVKTSLIKMLEPYKTHVHTITFDNGKEFAYHLEVAKTLEASTFFATPYHSWERGANENTNGLIRQYFPKKTDFATITNEQVKNVERLLNSRPRKCLGYKSPAEVFGIAA